MPTSPTCSIDLSVCYNTISFSEVIIKLIETQNYASTNQGKSVLQTPAPFHIPGWVCCAYTRKWHVGDYGMWLILSALSMDIGIIYLLKQLWNLKTHGGTTVNCSLLPLKFTAHQTEYIIVVFFSSFVRWVFFFCHCTKTLLKWLWMTIKSKYIYIYIYIYIYMNE